MNGIRYGLGIVPRSLLTDIPRSLCHGNRMRHKVDSLGERFRCIHTSGVCLGTKDRESRASQPKDLSVGPDLVDFILEYRLAKQKAEAEAEVAVEEKHPYLTGMYNHLPPKMMRFVYYEIYGCQMNFNDAAVVHSILSSKGYLRTLNPEKADYVLLMTCSIRDSAEAKVWNKLEWYRGMRAKAVREGKRNFKIGVLGCMARRLKEQIFAQCSAVDLIAGPDSYKDLPRLLALASLKKPASNVLLSVDETYADVRPVVLDSNSVSAFVTIMRGCDNMCTYCIVPFTRGKERSRPIESILDEVRILSDQGVKEVTLLGQNVNSYRDTSEINYSAAEKSPTHMADGFKTVYKPKIGGMRFSELLDRVSLVNPEMRIRFTSPHPKDFPDEVLQLISERPNICNHLHLPAQSGNSNVLERMRRGYTREAYLNLVEHVRSIIPDVRLSSDFIAGFCGETEEEFNDTISLMELVQYDRAFLFMYSMREKTKAHRTLEDNVEESVKKSRLASLISLWKKHAEMRNENLVGSQQLVLIEERSRRSSNSFHGRDDGNTRVIVPEEAIPSSRTSTEPKKIQPGDYVVVQISSASCLTLQGIPLYHSTLSDFGN